jgi:hypothetical protein
MMLRRRWKRNLEQGDARAQIVYCIHPRRGKANPPTPTLQVFSRWTNSSLIFTFRGHGLVISVLVMLIRY